jgi:hypothetical protein
MSLCNWHADQSARGSSGCRLQPTAPKNKNSRQGDGSSQPIVLSHMKAAIVALTVVTVE